jgi:uncharacterized protein (DUF58 family)
MTSALSPGIPGNRFIDPAVLARIGNLELVARTVVEGFLTGLHRSPNIGASTDFAEHRPYVPGDDIRRVDWKLLARRDRLYMKEYEAETNTNFVVLLDVSRSMSYTGDPGRMTKLEYGCTLAACLAYFAGMQRDRVGLATFATKVEDYVPPRARHLSRVLHALDRASRRAEPGPARDLDGVSSTSLPFESLADPLRRRSVVVVISDLYEEPDSVASALDRIRGRGNDVIVFHLMDPAELNFDFVEPGTFVDAESGERLPVIPDALRDDYRAVVASHVDQLQRVLRDRRADYALFNTMQPLDAALYSYLGMRHRFEKRRR